MNPTDILNNTILIPYHDSLVSDKPLPANAFADTLSPLEKSKWTPNLRNIEDTYIKVNGGTAQKLIMLQSIAGISMNRENEQRKNHDYVVNLPGRVSYSDVTIRHLFTREKFFLDWLMNGVSQNGVSRADIEIHINITNGNKMGMVFTLYDSFPVKWELKDYLMTETGEGGSAPLLMEEVTLTYSKINFAMKPLA